MKLLFTLACFGLMCVVAALDSVCKLPPSMSVLSEAIVTEDCNVCEQLTNVDTDFWEKCGMFMDQLILDKLMMDCERIVKTKKKGQLDAFWDTLKLTCKLKTGLGPFKVLDCGCDPCVELLKEDSEFMEYCAPNMPDYMDWIQECRQKKDHYDQLWYFYKALKAECHEWSGHNISIPICKCDVCWLLFEEQSDFMKKCGDDMDELMRDKLLDTCEKVMCDPIELGYFKINLELICERKGKEPFKFPECACEECWKLFQTDSKFMQTCGSAMSPLMRMELMKACYANMDTLNHFMTFLDNLELVCYKKTGAYFGKEWCKCLDCLLLEDPEQTIWKNCTHNMTEPDRIEMREECLAASKDDEEFEIYKAKMESDCGEDFPLCETCDRQDLCIEFVIDTSGSITNDSFDKELDFVRAVINEFANNIGAGKTRIGLIQFSTQVELVLSLDVEADQTAVSAGVDYIRTHRLLYRTNTPAGIIEMTADMGSYCSEAEREKFCIVLTDGLHNEGNLTLALAGVSPDVKMIAIGFGDRLSYNELKKIAMDDEDNVFRAQTVAQLQWLIEDLKSHIGCGN